MLVGLTTRSEASFVDIDDGTGEMAQTQNGQYGEFKDYLYCDKRDLAW